MAGSGQLTVDSLLSRRCRRRTTAPPAMHTSTRPGGPRARLGWLVRVDVAAQRVHRPARRRRPRGDRRRPARPRRRAQAARPDGYADLTARIVDALPDGPVDAIGFSLGALTLLRTVDRRAAPVPSPRARRHRAQRVRARPARTRPSRAGSQVAAQSRTRPRLTTTSPACSPSTPTSRATMPRAWPPSCAGRTPADHARGSRPRHVPGARRRRRPRLRPARRRARRSAPRRPLRHSCATPTTSPRPSRSRSSTPRSSSSTPSPPDGVERVGCGARTVRASSSSPRDVGTAVERLRTGGLVAIPTETVYGLAADAENPSAVARIFEIKGRPAGHPLIVHLGGRRPARRLGTLRPAGGSRPHRPPAGRVRSPCSSTRPTGARRRHRRAASGRDPRAVAPDDARTARSLRRRPRGAVGEPLRTRQPDHRRPRRRRPRRPPRPDARRDPRRRRLPGRCREHDRRLLRRPAPDPAARRHPDRGRRAPAGRRRRRRGRPATGERDARRALRAAL